MKRWIALMIALCLVLPGCGQEAAEETTAATEAATEVSTEATTEAATQPTTEAPTEPPTEAPTEPAPLPANVNPLTGETLEADSNDRPYAIMINNHKAALPHCGVSGADVIYEIPVEGGMTRFMAIFMDPSQTEHIGSVRSARPPFVDIVQGYDALYSSASGDQTVRNQIASAGVDYLNGLTTSRFYRDQKRLNSGYALEHTLFVDGDGLEKFAADKGMRTTRKEDQRYGFYFDDSAPFDGESAEKIVISFQSGGKTTTCHYDADAGAYTLYQQKQDYIDGNTGDLVEFRNILILEAESHVMENGVHVHMENVGEGSGWYARDGKLIPITWSRESLSSPYVYKTAQGDYLSMGIGTSYIALITHGAPVQYE